MRAYVVRKLEKASRDPSIGLPRVGLAIWCDIDSFSHAVSPMPTRCLAMHSDWLAIRLGGHRGGCREAWAMFWLVSRGPL